MDKLILYNYYRSSTSYRARIALHHKQLDFEYRPVHLLNEGGQQHKADYRNINPIGEVPSLVHNEKVIAQSFAIIEYLEDAFPQHPIFPKDAYSKALVRQFCENINCSAHPYQNLKTLQYLEKTAGYDQAKKEAWISHWVGLAFEATEKLLEKHSGLYSFGDQITAADMFLTPQVVSAERFNVETSKYKNIRKVYDNTMKLESFKKGHPSCQIDTPAT